MKIVLNGNERDLPAGATVRDVLDALQLRSEQVAVERNRELVPRGEHDATRLAEGDSVEVVTLVGGG